MNKAVLSTGVAVLFALTTAPLSYGAITSADHLQPQTYKGTTYISGGVGADERDTLRSMTRNDNLELSFADQQKDYIGGATVSVKNDKGEQVLQAASDGPLFYAKLPAGVYTVAATANGKTLTRQVRIDNNRRTTVYFTWNEPDNQMASAGSLQGSSGSGK